MEEVIERNIHSNGIDNQESDGNTSFLRAARNGQLEKVLEHLKTNIDINTSNANGLNALHLASKDGHVEIVEELLKRGAIVDAATKKGNTALHIASLAGQEEVVKLLVHHGASVNVQSQNGFTPLYMAAQENHDNVVKFLLANGANQSLSTEDGFTPLAVAMQQGHDKVVTVLLENDTRGKVRLPALHIAAKKDDVRAAKLLLENDHNPDVTSKSGFTPLHIASHYGNQSIANLLIQKGADVNYSAKHNITPLHVAAKWGKNNMVAVLLEQGAHIEAKTRDGLTPLHCAARSGHEQVVDMLLEKSAPISSKTKNGLAPLHMAAQGDHVDAARILLYHRAPVDEVTVDYLTALHVAAHCGHVRVAKLLVDRQADANARALNGFTPLHIACKKNRIKVVELLLKHGACIGATTESGLTPLHVASFMGCMNIVIYLLQHDASPDIPTVRGETPLHLAARANQTDIIRILLRNGAQVDARAREQQTPLHIASRLGNVDIVMLLLQHGAKVDNSTKDMYTALHIAAKEGQDEVAAVLIENGASLNATTKKGFTPLHLAAKYGHLKVAKLLLQKEAPVDAQGKNGVTPLHVASHYDHQNVALLLLDKGASPHANAKNGHTPLHIAARKNQMDIAHTLLEYGAQPDAESKAGFTPLHLSAQEGHTEISALLLEHKATPSQQSKNGLTPMHLCAQENKVGVAQILHNNGAEIDIPTKGGYTPLHIASHYGQADMVKFLLSKEADVKATSAIGYTPLHQAAQQGHTNIVNILLENSAQPNAVTNNGQTPLNIAQKLGYITVIDTLKEVTNSTEAPSLSEEKYRVVAPEAMQETYLSDSEEEGEDTLLGDQTYRYLTADEMKSLGDDSLPIDVTRDERIDSNRMVGLDDLNAFPPRHIEDSISPEHIHPNYVEYIKKSSDNVDISKHPLNIGFLVSFLVDARGGAMRGCRHSGVRVIVPPRCAHSPTRITCRYVRPQRTPHPPPLMEGEALASRVLELGPVGATFLGPVIIEVPHFAALRGKEREIVVLRSDNGESWKEHTVEATEDVLNEILRDSFDPEDLNQLEDVSLGRITRIVTQDFPQYFAVISRIRQEVHAIGPEGGMVSSTVVPQVQAVFPQGALTKKIKVGLQAQPIDPELTAKMLGHGVAVSPVVTVEPRRRKFHKAITLSMPAPRAHSQGMINQYSGSAPTLRLLCSITGGTSRAQWEDVTGSTPLTFVNDCVSFTTTVSARFWLMDCRNIGDATKMATELYREAIHVPFIAKFMVFAKRIDPLEARLRVFCMTDDKEDKTLEYQEQFTEIAKSRDVEVLEGKSQYIEFVGNLVPVTKSGEQLQFAFRAFKENRLPFSVRVKDQHAEAVSRCLFMREPKVQKGEPPQQPICILNILLPDDIVSDTISLTDSDSVRRKYYATENFDYYRQDPRLADISNLLGDDWVDLANQLGLTTSEINVIKSEYPDSVAKQAQSMLRMWLSQSGNRTQANTLDNALRRISREDIVIQCLNEDNRNQQIVRIKSEDREKYRLRDQISEQDFSKREDYYLENERGFKTKPDTFDKYSAEEKEIEPSDEEDDFNKTVPEIREQIVKRLSNARTIPASSQRVEIVQEISSIKRKSLVEDKLAEAQHKAGPDAITIITVKPTLKVSHEKKMASEDTGVEKTPSDSISKMPDEHKEKEAESRIDVSDLKTPADSDRRDSILLEEVTHRLESKKPLPKLIADEDPKSPKFSRTPPPSPADFIMREKEATTAQEWCATKTDLIDASTTQQRKTSQEAEGQTTSPQYLDKLEKKLLDKTCVVKFPNTEIEIAYDFEQTLRETNAFLKYECQAEPYDAWTDNRYKDIKSEIESSPNTTPTKKRRKKGIFKTLKSLVTKSTENLSSEPEGLSPKSDRTDRKKKTFLVTSAAISKNTEQIETPSHKESSHGHDEICEYRSEKDSQNDRAEIQKMFSESATTYQAERKDSDQITVGTTVKENVSSERQEEKTSEKGNILKIVDDSKDGFSKELDRSVNNSTQEKFSLDRGATIDGIDENLKHDSEVTAIRPLSCKDGKEDFKIERNAEISDAERPTPQTSKKPGIWSFLTKKSKKSTAVGNEENVEKILEKNGDELNVTQLFLEQEQNNYYCGSRHVNIENNQNVLSDLDKNQTKIKSIAKAGICESFLSKLKPSDAALIDPEEASYIKFDEDDLIYDPVTTVIHEKQKKVTFDEKAPEEILPADTSIDEPAAKRLICRLKEMNADDQLINKQDSVERDSDCSRKIKGIKGRQNTNSEFDYPYNCSEQEVAYTINMIDQTDRFLETEKVSYQGEIISSMENIKQGDCGPKELPKPAHDEQCRKYQSPLKEKEVLRDIASTRTEMSQDDHSKSAASIIDELYNKDMSTIEQPDQDFIDLTDLFLKKEIDEYSDVKLVKLTIESSSLDQIPKKNENSKSKRFFVLSSKKRKTPKESLVPREERKTNNAVNISNSETSIDQRKEYTLKTSTKEPKVELSPHLKTSNRSAEKRDEKFIMLQSEHDEKFSFENIERDNSFPKDDQPIFETISTTRDFILKENKYYDGDLFTKKIQPPTEPDQKTTSDKLISHTSSLSQSREKRDENEVVPQSKHDKHSSQDKNTSDNIENENILPKEDQRFFKTISETKDFLSAENEHYDEIIYIKENSTPVDPDLNTTSKKFSPQMSTSKEKQDVNKIMTQSKQDEYLGQDKDTPENIEKENILPIKKQAIIKTISKTRDFLLAENEYYDGMTYVKKYSTSLDSDSKIISDEIGSHKITLSTEKREGNEIMPKSKDIEHLSQDKYTSDIIGNEDILPKEEKKFFKTISETKDFLLAENEHYDGVTYMKENSTPIDPDLNSISVKFSPEMSTSKEKQDVNKIMTQSKQDEYLGQGKNTPENIENENILLIKEQAIIKTISETRDFLLAENENYDGMTYVKKQSAPLDSDSKIISDEIGPHKITLSTVKRDGNEIIPQSKHNEHLSQDKYTSDVIDNEDILPKEKKQFFKTISETKDFLLAENEHYDGMTFIKENLTPVDADLNTISIKFSPQMSTPKEKQDVKRIMTQSKQDEYFTQDKDTPENIMNENISPNQEKSIIETISETRDFLSVENEYYDGMTYVKKYSGSFDPDWETISPDRITFSQSTEKRDENEIMPQSKHDKHFSQDEDTSDNIQNKESFETISKTRDFLLVENELYDGMTHVKKISSSIDSNLKTINDELIPHMTSTQSTTKRGGNGIMIQSEHDEYLTRGNIENDNISPKEEQHGFKIISKTRDFLLAENQCYDGMTDIKKKSTPLDPNVETISKEFTSHMSTLSQSLETRDENKIIHQSQHDPHLSQEEHTCFIGNENIPPTKEQPIGRTISITRDFLSAENEFYDGTTYTKKIRAPVDVDLRVINEKLSPHMIISSQSSEKRDAKEITSQSEYTEQVTRDKNISDNIEFDNIVASKQQPIGETISKTRKFLLAENNFYDETTNKKKNLTPVHSHLKTISDQCIENRISVKHEFPEKNMNNIDVREQSQGTHDANSDLGMNSLAFKLASKDDDEDSKSSTFHTQNPILSTDEFLHLEKYSYDSEVCQPPNDKKNNLNLSDNTHIGKSEKISDISNETITLKKSLASKETSEYRKSTDDIKDDISEDRLTQISPQRMIQSTTNFLSTEIMKYHDAKRKIHDLKSIKDSSNDTNTEIIKRDGDIDQSNKIPEKKTKGFLNIFSKKTKPKIEKRDDDKLIRTSDFVDVTATDEFLNTEKFFYHDGNRHITNKDEPKVIEATSSVTSSDISKTQTSSNKDKSSRPRGIFKIFSRKSEEKDLNMSNQARIDLYDENKSTATENKHDNRKEDEIPVDIPTFLHVLKANTFYQNCDNISQVTDVFLKTERNLYNDTDRSKSSYEASKELRERSYESEESENQSLKKQNSEKPLKKRNYLKIFHRKSEEEKHFSKHVNDVESHKAQKSGEDKFEVDQQSEQRERFNIFGKKFRHKEKKYVRTEIDNKIDDHKDNLKLMQITNDFLHTERDNYEDVLPITRIDYHNRQLNGKSLRQEQKPLAHMKSSELKAENISEQDKTSRFGSQNSESISSKELDSDINKLNSTRSEVDESPNKLQQKKSGEKKKIKDIRRKEKEGKTKGIFNLFSRRSKSKERNDDFEDIEDLKLSFNDVQVCRMFLEKEIEMYVDSYSTLKTNQLNRTHSSVSKARESDKTGFGVDDVGKSSKLSPRCLVSEEGPETVDIIDGEEAKFTTFDIAPDSAVFMRSHSQHLGDERDLREDNAESERNLEQRPSTENESMEDIEKYNAFDFIREEVENFEKSRLPFTDTIDTSFRVETEIGHPEGNEAVEKITKRIIISEKLIEKPRSRASNTATYIDTADMKKVALTDTVGYQQGELISKSTSDLIDLEYVNRGTRDVMNISDKLPINRKSTSEEKLECIQAEYVHNMKDPELCKGDVIEDVSPLEKKIRIISNNSEEKITDLDESLPKTLIEIPDDKTQTNLDKKIISCVVSEAIKEQITGNEDESHSKKREHVDVLSSEDSRSEKKISVTKLGDKDFQPQDIAETIHVTENFVKELDIQFHPEKSIFSKDETNASAESTDMEKQIMQIPLPIGQNKITCSVNDNDENLLVNFGSNFHETLQNTYQVESDIHEINKDDKRINSFPRKPLFRLESDEDELVTKVKEFGSYETNISEITSDCPTNLKEGNTKLILDNKVVVDSKSDVEIIEDKLRDLGKALDALEKLSEVKSDDKNEQLEQKKLRRVERKFERMASETLEPSTNNETEVKTPNSRETDRYQQLVSHLSTDEVISLESDYNNLWDEYTFSKSDEWDSKTPESQADVLELPQGDAATQPPGTTDLSMIRDIKHDSSKETEEAQSKSQTYDQHQLSEQMKELLEEMEKTNKM